MQLCPVCWWEDDGQEDRDAAEVRLTVNGQLSLNEARAELCPDSARPIRDFSLTSASPRPPRSDRIPVPSTESNVSFAMLPVFRAPQRFDPFLEPPYHKTRYLSGRAALKFHGTAAPGLNRFGARARKDTKLSSSSTLDKQSGNGRTPSRSRSGRRRRNPRPRARPGSESRMHARTGHRHPGRRGRGGMAQRRQQLSQIRQDSRLPRRQGARDRRPAPIRRRNPEGSHRHAAARALQHRAVAELGIRPVGQPQVTELTVDESSPLHVKAVFEFIPPFSIDGYKDVTVPKPSVEVTEEEFQQEIEQLRESHATIEPVEEDRAPEGRRLGADQLQGRGRERPGSG